MGAATRSIARPVAGWSMVIFCIATLASLGDEFGWPSATAITGSVLALALAVGAVLARVVA